MPSMRMLSAGLTAFACLSSQADPADNNDRQVAVQAPRPAREVTDIFNETPPCGEEEDLHEVNSAYRHGPGKSSVDMAYAPGHVDLARRQLDNLTASASVSLSIPTVIVESQTNGPVTTITEGTTVFPTTTIEPSSSDSPPPPPPTSTPAPSNPSSEPSPTSEAPLSPPSITSTPPPTSTSDDVPDVTTAEPTSTSEPSPPSTSAVETSGLQPSTTSATPSSTTSETSSSTASAIPPSTTSAPTTSGTSSGRVVTTTDEFGNMLILSGVSDGAVITTIDARGRTITTTYNRRPKAISSTEVLTSTLANGEQQTLTSVAIITPSVASGSDGEVDASTTSDGGASLVTGNAAPETRRLGKEAFALVAGAAGVALLL